MDGSAFCFAIGRDAVVGPILLVKFDGIVLPACVEVSRR